MEITEVKVYPVQEEKLKAFVSVVIDQCFMVNDIKIIQGRQGLFISMPSRKKKNGEFKDVAHPLNNETRKMIEAKVLHEYDRVLAVREGAPDPEPTTIRAPVEDRSPEQREGEGREGRDRTGSAASEARTEKGIEEEETTEKTLEEVEEMHLRDSFWTVP